MMLSSQKIPVRCEQTDQPADIRTVWIGAEEKIASFHYVEGYQDQSFPHHDQFVHFLCSLQEQGYRFQ